jgi:hypothetical protein
VQTLHVVATARRSTFCLEPQGDSPYRRSFTDSIVLGCIPVLFSRLQDDYTYPWLWGSWREEARVLVPRQAFLSGRLDLNRLLSSAPPELIAHLQRTIAQQARVFQFSEVDDEGDQLHALIVGALREARRLELERGAPQYTQWECTLARQCSVSRASLHWHWQ